jgi:signal peptidase I
MGDNRSNSADSRFWGFVPHDHVLGRADLVIFSFNAQANSFFSQPRWGRFFSVIR